MIETAIEHYLSQFPHIQNNAAETWLGELRHNALDKFRDQGFPSTRAEDWRYTDIRPILKKQFNFVKTQGQDAAIYDIQPAKISGLDCYEMVFIDGVYSAKDSNIIGLPNDIRIGPLASAIVDQDDWIKRYLNNLVNTDRNGFIALNTAFIRDGAVLYIPNNTLLDKPINLIYLNNNTNDVSANNLRNLVVLGKKAEACIIETYFGCSGNEYFTNTITEINLKEEASLTHYKLQQEGAKAYHIGYTHTHQSDRSIFKSHQISLGGKFARSDLDVNLDGNRSECILNGFFMANDNQYVDHHVEVNHSSPNTQSSETFRGVLGGHARGVFNGKIIVHKDAQKSDARLSNANLLLSNNAEIDTKPELEIYADDVKCSHGATIGRLDEQMLFYLRTRAIKKDLAKSLLTFAFAEEVLSHIHHEEIRDKMEHVIVNKFPESRLIQEFIK